MNQVKDREPYNQAITITTTQSQKEALEMHANNFNASVSEVMREIIRVWINDPQALMIKDFSQQQFNDTVTCSYNLFRSILATVQASNLETVDKETVIEINRFCGFLQEKIAVNIGKKIKEWNQVKDINRNPN